MHIFFVIIILQILICLTEKPIYIEMFIYGLDIKWWFFFIELISLLLLNMNSVIVIKWSSIQSIQERQSHFLHHTHTQRKWEGCGIYQSQITDTPPRSHDFRIICRDSEVFRPSPMVADFFITEIVFFVVNRSTIDTLSFPLYFCTYNIKNGCHSRKTCKISYSCWFGCWWYSIRHVWW